MRRSIVGISLCFFAFVCVGQSLTRQADSLKTVLQTHTVKDTIRASTLINYVKVLFYVQPDSSMMRYADETLRISQALGWKRGVARAWQIKGMVSHYFLSESG